MSYVGAFKFDTHDQQGKLLYFNCYFNIFNYTFFMLVGPTNIFLYSLGYFIQVKPIIYEKKRLNLECSLQN